MSRRRNRKKPPEHQRRRTKPTRDTEPTGQASAEDQELIQELRAAMRADSPVPLAMTVSTIMAACEPRSSSPLDQTPEGPSLTELVDSLIATSYAETTAALTVIACLTSDELLVKRIDKELATRHHPLPEWLGGMREAAPVPEVWELTESLGDGDNYFLGVNLPSGDTLSALVYVDHNLGTVVKDAFLSDEKLDALLETVRSRLDGQVLQRTDAAQGRAVMEAAIDAGATLYPPLESDTWPGCRPAVEWMLRLLPAGAAAPERPDWSDEDLARLSEDFFDSSYGRDLDADDERSLLDSVLWYGTDYGPGDPLRWSPTSVEILLSDWFPRKVIADTEYLAKLPRLLRAFVRYCHQVRGISADRTHDTLSAVDSFEPEYQRIIRSDRPQGPDALLRAFFGEDTESGASVDIGALGGGFGAPAIMLDFLASTVGGRIPLEDLSSEPLPDEPFEWAGIPEDVHQSVAAILVRCDAYADDLADAEYRTAMRRFLSRAAAVDPAIFRRKASPDRGAAAVAWVIGRANALVGPGSAVQVQDLQAWFGVSGSVSQRAGPFLRANGVDPAEATGYMSLGALDLLVSQYRALLIEQRDYWMNEAGSDGP